MNWWCQALEVVGLLIHCVVCVGVVLGIALDDNAWVCMYFPYSSLRFPTIWICDWAWTGLCWTYSNYNKNVLFLLSHSYNNCAYFFTCFGTHKQERTCQDIP